ncbi:MAG: 6-bladed beta-propeller [Rhodospirillales bacterium CG15_BIG_FIL_POST_REV_8_21_14_020_66_15]|nr:MAG: 6-bladed beta-propeller [Rhodospirillales bacterium CG15_BIG_FIL_POST_REV_8_21_14_020_66_15]
MGPETVVPKFEPQASGPVWPLPPDAPRYAYAGTLIGERNFLKQEDKVKQKTKSFFAFVVGLVFGEPDYVELRRPVSGLVDKQGRILVVDASHKAVMVFDLKAKRLLKWERTSEYARFISPVAIADDGKGGVWVTDSEMGEAIRLDPAGAPIARLGKGVLDRPTGIARNPDDGRIYISDTAANNIKVFDPSGRLIDTIGGPGVQAGEFNTPTHLYYRSGRLYVADTLNFRIQVLDAQNDPKVAFGRVGIKVGNMTRPKGVSVGGDGRIYVVESYFDHLLVFTPSGQLLLPIGGTGRGAGQFYLPGGVWTDNQNRVYVADMFNGRVSIFKELTAMEEHK